MVNVRPWKRKFARMGQVSGRKGSKRGCARGFVRLKGGKDGGDCEGNLRLQVHSRLKSSSRVFLRGEGDEGVHRGGYFTRGFEFVYLSK